jgi:hypothetical protein
MTSLNYIAGALPKWASVVNRTEAGIEIEATSPKKSGKVGVKYYLVIYINHGAMLEVSEISNKNHLPNCCLERHINTDGSFCLYLNSTNLIASNESALYWWNALGDYLNNQDYATKYGQWPLDKGLCHGDAAFIQLKMEKAVSELGWEDELRLSWFRGQGWLFGTLMRPNKRKTGFVNSRSPCIRGCKQLHSPNKKLSCSKSACRTDCNKLHKPILRSSCPNKDVVDELNRLEIARRQLENDFINGVKKLGIECCGTMKNCSLK